MTFDIATCILYTGIDPITNEALEIACVIRAPKLQQTPMQFFKLEIYFKVRAASTE